MDSIDRQILVLLQKNARIPISEISSRVKLSVPAVSERIRKLESGGMIRQYTAIVSAEKLNIKLTALMFVSMETPKYFDGFAHFVSTQSEILECYYLAGDFDYLIKILTADTGTLEKLLARVKSVPGVRKTKTVVALATLKNNHSVMLEENGAQAGNQMD